MSIFFKPLLLHIIIKVSFPYIWITYLSLFYIWIIPYYYPLKNTIFIGWSSLTPSPWHLHATAINRAMAAQRDKTWVSAVVEPCVRWCPSSESLSW